MGTLNPPVHGENRQPLKGFSVAPFRCHAVVGEIAKPSRLGVSGQTIPLLSGWDTAYVRPKVDLPNPTKKYLRALEVPAETL